MFVIAGATGNTGRVVAETLLERGEPVRVIVRSEEKGAEWRARGAEIAVVDIRDSGELAGALRGSEGAYLLNPPVPESRWIRSDQNRTTESIAAAVAASSVPHVVFLSSIGAQHDSGTGPITVLHGAERRFRKLVARFTYLRAAYFVENWAMVLQAAKSDGVLPCFLSPADRPIPMVSTTDIGHVAAAALLESPSEDRIIELSGPEDVSPSRVARTLSELLDRDVSVHEIPRDRWEPTLSATGVSSEMVQMAVEMYDGINRGHVDWQRGDATARRGSVTLEEALRRLCG